MGKISIRYLTKEGFKNTWVNRLMSTASVAVLMSCLIMVGVAIMMVVNIQAMMDKMEDENVIMVFIEDDATDKEIDKLGKNIKAITNVEKAIFVSKEEALEEQIKEIGAAAELFKDEEDNYLPDAYKVIIKDLNKFDVTAEKLQNLENVDTIRENKDLALTMLRIEKSVTYISIAIIVILLLVSLFIISNTIKITMYNRKLEINIMKSVGATDWFIRWPFMVEGMVLGFFSGAIATGLVWLIYRFAIMNVIDILGILGMKAVSFNSYALPMLGAFIIIGVLIGSIGSAMSIRRYLKEQESIAELDE